jgi:hypothetical protein
MSLIMNSTENQRSQAKFILFAVATGAVTFFLFPAISYTSITFYGLPAAAFVLSGYVLWLFLMPRNSSLAIAFSLGFIPPVAFCLIILLAIKPLFVGMILLPVASFWVIRRYARKCHLKRRLCNKAHGGDA